MVTDSASIWLRVVPLVLATLTGPLATAASFEDATARSGLNFEHFNGMSGAHYFPEMMGSGVALIDYDKDGDLDVYLVQGAMLGPNLGMDQALFPPKHPLPLSDRLYRNDGQLRFVDVTADAGLSSTTQYGMGVAVGDFDADGWPDLYVANFGSNRALRNTGTGAFEDVTETAGLDDPRWSVGASFLDYDGDGDDDLYVVNYVTYTYALAKTCRSHNNAPDYCSPQSYQPAADRLFRNMGNGRFADATSAAGLGHLKGPGLGVIAADFNQDKRVDLYVANDGAANFFLLSQPDRTFLDEAMLAGVAVNMAGIPEASMGVAAADHDGDGDLDLFMTHLDRQTNTLYENDGQGWFTDRTGGSVLGASSFSFTGFGTAWFDYDNDGWLDLFSANGAVTKIEAQLREGDIFPLKQKNQLWRNLGAGRYEEVSDRAGDVFSLSEVSRGAAVGDLDNDGDLDLVVTNNNGPARILENRVGHSSSWLGVGLTNATGERAIHGAKVSADVGGRRLVRVARTDGSYASSRDGRILFGLGQTRAPVALSIEWPDGTQQSEVVQPINQYHTIAKKTKP